MTPRFDPGAPHKRPDARKDVRSARDISYSMSAKSRAGRAMIRSIENVTGRPRLIRMALGYEQDVARGEDFWAVMRRRYGVEFDFLRHGPEAIPASGPAVVVANHPFGILDGLALGAILSARRKDFKIVANSVFRKVGDLEANLLPISFDPGREAQALNLQSRKAGIEYLRNGGVIAIFPGGTVSTASKPFGKPIDPVWKNFTAKLVSQPEAAVIPVFFDGQNSRMFQVATHVSQTLRLALLIKEFGAKLGRPLRVAIGDPIPRAEIDARKGQPAALMSYLRQATYGLSPTPFADLSHGWNGE